METTEADFDKFYAPIGKVAAEWAFLEGYLDKAIMVMMEAKEQYARIIVNPMSCRIKIQALRSLIALRGYSPEIRTKMSKLLDEIDALRDRRNEAVHSFWGLLHENEGNYAGQSIKHESNKTTKQTWFWRTDKELQDLASDIGAKGVALRVFLKRDVALIP